MTGFRVRIAQVLSSVLGLSAVGCGGQAEKLTPAEQKDRLREGFDDNYCTEAEGGPEVTGINPARGQDYIAYRWMGSSVEQARAEVEARRPSEEELAGFSPEQREEILSELYQFFVSRRAEIGVCSVAAGCTKNVLPPQDGFGNSDSHYHYMAFASGVPTFVTNAEEMRAFFGDIDTPPEAFHLAQADGGHRFDCGEDNYRVVEGGFEIYTETGSTCGGDITGHRLLVKTDGDIEELRAAVVEKGESGCVIGRFPAGNVYLGAAEATHPVAAYFARAAQLEASSVVAFEELARDLHHYGAPSRLVEWARRAAREEADHARLCFALCRRYGGTAALPQVRRNERQSLLDIALNNAVEGLTREAFGALLAHHQAVTAKDPAIARIMRLIAEDETGHAEFSLELHSWLLRHLSEPERAQVNAARVAARVRFESGAHVECDAELESAAGLPTADISRRLFLALFQGQSDRLFSLKRSRRRV